jgi:hypothetical protein
MPRKHKVYTVSEDNRDNGKHYFIMEMDASQGADWALQAWFLVSQNGVNVPEDIAKSGMQGIAMMGLQALYYGIPFENAKPLINQLFNCVRFIPDLKLFRFDPNLSIDQQPGTRPFVESDIEEISTHIMLRMEALKVHVDFSKPGAESTSETNSSTMETPGSTIIQTSPPKSERLSPRVRRP